MDFKDYQSQIKELISLRNEPDFNELLNNILFGVSNSDKFLIKMELNRLANTCIRIIDLRDKVSEYCQLHRQGTLEHYLTTDTIKVLQENINLYGLYSVGVFEAVYFYIAQQKEKNNKKQLIDELPKKQDQCEFLHLSQKHKRGAPRMFFVSAVQILLADGTTIEAHTSNISTTGVKIKLQRAVQLLHDSYLHITFRGLQLEHQQAILANKITYQLVKQTHEGDSHYLYLMYADSDTQFIPFLKKFIRVNQYKYKMDVHYYYQQAKISALNTIYLSEMNTLPIYLDNSLSSPFLFALKNNANKKILNEWTCNGINQLPVLFDELRLAQLLAHARKKTETTLYCFTHTANGKNYFLSASEEELLEKGLKSVFINYGSNKKSWRIYHLTLNSYQYQQSQNYDITEPVPAQFQQITHMATLQPLSPSFSVNPIIDKKDLNKINQFVHRDQKEIDVSIFTLFSGEQRKEARYLYKSKLSLHSQENNYTGELVDFSFSGLRIKLDQIRSLAPSTLLTINLSELQKVSTKFPLSHLQYKVIRNGPENTLHLQVCDTKTLDICNHFFFLLVQSNPNHFKCLPLKTAKQPPSNYLLEIAQEAFIDCVFFLSKDAGRPKIRFSAIDKVEHPLHKLFSMRSDNSAELSYYPLANNQLYARLITQPFKNSEEDGLFKEAFIYIKASKNEDNQWLINSFLDSDFKSQNEKIDFIVKADSEATFYALHYRIFAIEPVNLRSIEAEIRAISRFAIHLTKKLEEELCAINAMIEITDRTFQTLQALQQRE
ncbi:MAG: hypothetical protein ACJAS1_002541 [Oleiphilaceae bacterium]|jgi:hypothetical protein